MTDSREQQGSDECKNVDKKENERNVTDSELSLFDVYVTYLIHEYLNVEGHTMLSYTASNFHNYYKAELGDIERLKRHLHHHVREELHLDGSLLKIIRSSLSKSAVMFINLCLRFFSIQLFIGRRDRTLYSRKYDHPRSGASWTEKWYHPFREDEHFWLQNCYTDYKEVKVKVVTQFF